MAGRRRRRARQKSRSASSRRPPRGEKRRSPAQPIPWTVWVLGATLVAAALAFSSDIASLADVPKRSAIQLGLLVAAGVWIARDAGPPLAVPRSWPLFALFFVLASVGLARASDFYRAFETWLHWSFCLVAVFLALQVLRVGESRRQLLVFFAVGALIVSAVGLAQYYGLVAIAPEISPPSATFGNRNWAAQMLVACLPPLAAAWVLERSETRARIQVLAGALSFAILVKIASSAAFLAVAVEVALLATAALLGPELRRIGLERLRRRRVSIAAGAVLGLGLAFLTPDGFRGDPRLLEEVTGLSDAFAPGEADRPVQERVHASRTITERIGNDRVAALLVARSPALGIGLNDYAVAFPGVNAELGDPGNARLAREQAHTHNDWLQLAAELGVGAVAVVVCGWLLALRTQVRRLRGAVAGDASIWLSTGALAGLAGIAVQACFSYPIYNAVPPFLAALLVAVFAAEGPRVLAIGPLAGSRFRAVSLVALLALALPWAAWRSGVWRIEQHMARLSGLVAAGRWREAHEVALRIRSRDLGRLDYRAYEAQSQLARGETAEASRSVAALLAAYPDHPAGLALRAALLEEAGELDAALGVYERLLLVVPQEWSLYARAADCALAAKRPEVARRLLARGAARPDAPDALRVRAASLGASGRP